MGKLPLTRRAKCIRQFAVLLQQPRTGPIILDGIEIIRNESGTPVARAKATLTDRDKALAADDYTTILLSKLAILDLLLGEYVATLTPTAGASGNQGIWPILRDFETYKTTLLSAQKIFLLAETEKQGFRTAEMSILSEFYRNNGWSRYGPAELALRFFYEKKGQPEKANAVDLLVVRREMLRTQRRGALTHQERLLSAPVLNTTTEPWNIEAELLRDYERIIKVSDPLKRAVMIHNSITRIHPFYDANGRTARLMMTASLVHAGCRAPLFVLTLPDFDYHIAAEADAQAIYREDLSIDDKRAITCLLDLVRRSQ